MGVVSRGMLTFKLILLVGSLWLPWSRGWVSVSIISGKAGGLGSSSVGWVPEDMSCIVFLPCRVSTFGPSNLTTFAIGSCLLPLWRLLVSGLRLVLVTGRSCIPREINLLSVFGGVGMSGFGITFVGLVLAVLLMLRSNLLVLFWLVSVGSPKTQVISQTKSLRCGTGLLSAKLTFGRLRTLR